jgi:thioredoxin-dependent peroxiredoxin
MKNFHGTRWGLSLLLPAAISMLTSAACPNPDNFTAQAVNRSGAFTLSDARGKYVALHFLLKTECPFCIKHTRDYVQKAPSLPGVVHIFLKPDTDEEIRAWNTKLESDHSTSITIYRDPDAKLADAYGIPNGYQFHKQVVHYPALILIDPTGKEVFRYVGKSNVDRLSFEQLAAQVSQLRVAPRTPVSATPGTR